MTARIDCVPDVCKLDDRVLGDGAPDDSMLMVACYRYIPQSAIAFPPRR